MSELNDALTQLSIADHEKESRDKVSENIPQSVPAETSTSQNEGSATGEDCEKPGEEIQTRRFRRGGYRPERKNNGMGWCTRPPPDSYRPYRAKPQSIDLNPVNGWTWKTLKPWARYPKLVGERKFCRVNVSRESLISGHKLTSLR